MNNTPCGESVTCHNVSHYSLPPWDKDQQAVIKISLGNETEGDGRR